MIEKTENIKIDKSRAIDKKDILIPQAQQGFEIAKDILKAKKEIAAKLKESQPGYVIFSKACPHPNPEVYEIEDEDITFLKRIFPQELKDWTYLNQVFQNPIITDFTSLIEYIDLTRDFSCSKLALSSNKFSPEAIAKFVEHWKNKTNKSKYPLIRKLWKTNVKKNEFGELDELRIAFRERERERMRLRKIMKLSDNEILENLVQMKKEAEISLLETRMILAREQLKYYLLQIRDNRDDLPFSLTHIKSEILPKYDEIILEAEEVIEECSRAPAEVQEQKINELVAVEPLIAPIILLPPKLVHNDIAYFISSLISELSVYGFALNDFKYENLKRLNEKIRKLKRPQSQCMTSFLERTLDFTLVQSSHVPNPRFDKLVFFKEISFTNPYDCFVEKFSEKQLACFDSFEYKSKNFAYDYLVKRDINHFKSNCSMYRVPLSLGQNPFLSGNKNSHSRNNSFIESIKLNKYNDIFGEIPVGDSLEEDFIFPYNNSFRNEGFSRSAEKQLTDMSFELRFKSFMSTKRVK
jgi:hypothetical protein